MKRKTIAVDIDDVLSASAAGFTTYSNKRWGLRLDPQDYTENWATFWGVSLEEAFKRVPEVERDAPALVSGYAHFADAVPVLYELARSYTLVIVTSRRRAVKEMTDKWLQKHFPGLFQAVHYMAVWDDDTDVATVHYRLAQTKTELRRELGAEYLIDDQPKHCIDAADAGIQALLFGTYKWNKAVTQRANLTKVADWQAIGEYFDVAR